MVRWDRGMSVIADVPRCIDNDSEVFWNLWIISMFELAAVPQNWTLQVHIGSRIALYSSNLFSATCCRVASTSCSVADRLSIRESQTCIFQYRNSSRVARLIRWFSDLANRFGCLLFARSQSEVAVSRNGTVKPHVPRMASGTINGKWDNGDETSVAWTIRSVVAWTESRKLVNEMYLRTFSRLTSSASV